MQPREIAAKVAYIPQTHTPTFHYTVLEMVLMGTTHRVRGLQSPGAKEVAIAREALAQVLLCQGFFVRLTQLSRLLFLPA